MTRTEACQIVQAAYASHAAQLRDVVKLRALVVDLAASLCASIDYHTLVDYAEMLQVHVSHKKDPYP
jgi:hypothetical protein